MKIQYHIVSLPDTGKDFCFAESFDTTSSCLVSYIFNLLDAFKSTGIIKDSSVYFEPLKIDAKDTNLSPRANSSGERVYIHPHIHPYNQAFEDHVADNLKENLIGIFCITRFSNPIRIWDKNDTPLDFSLLTIHSDYKNLELGPIGPWIFFDENCQSFLNKAPFSFIEWIVRNSDIITFEKIRNHSKWNLKL